ncbi:MAG: glycerol-3-phosphate 1-O-acyltransferase PlsY, partial [bacterium]|nr:glycerol-3-phosphate 1-O-acyltransferase PlsY [bacterium]
MIWAPLGFLLGSIPFGLIVSKHCGVDIRALGSGNIGMTNVWRSLGWKPGLLVFVLDVLKGLVPTCLAYRACIGAQVTLAAVGPDPNPMFDYDTKNYEHLHYTEYVWLGVPSGNAWAYVPMVVGLAAVLGHTFTPWLRFKGGKGVATGLGVAMALYQWWILVPLTLFVVSLAVTRMVSLSSLLAAAAIAGLCLNRGLTHLWPFGIVVFLLVLWTHRSNIRRIIAGT